MVVDALHGSIWTAKQIYSVFFTLVHTVVMHIYVSHHTVQQVSLLGPCNLKLN